MGLDGLDGSLGLVEYRAPYGANNIWTIEIYLVNSPFKILLEALFSENSVAVLGK